MDQLIATIPGVPDSPWLRAGLVAAAFVVAAFVVRIAFKLVINLVAKRTETEMDERVAELLSGPAFSSTLVFGLWLAVQTLEPSSALQRAATGFAVSVADLLWTVALLRVGSELLQAASRNADRFRWIHPKTVALLEIVFKFVVAGAAVYIFCIGWGIDVTTWMMSAGVVGIAVGFAAKDTLANLFSGIFIIADSPYKVGDYIVLDSGVRGEVQEIGIRSTRILTRDDVEITIPNAVIGNSRIVNQTGGRYDKMRVRIKVSVAYGSDVDQVREVLLASADGVDHLAGDPSPRVRFRGFGASGLDFELLAWIEEPVFRGRVIDALNTKVYKAFQEAGIEIPYDKRDVYVKEWPRSAATDA